LTAPGAGARDARVGRRPTRASSSSDAHLRAAHRLSDDRTTGRARAPSGVARAQGGSDVRAARRAPSPRIAHAPRRAACAQARGDAARGASTRPSASGAMPGKTDNRGPDAGGPPRRLAGGFGS
jgi:hypothetical protein